MPMLMLMGGTRTVLVTMRMGGAGDSAEDSAADNIDEDDSADARFGLRAT